MTKDELMARLTAIEMKIKNADRDHFTSGGVLAVTITEVLPLCAAMREMEEVQRFLEVDRDQTYRERDEAIERLHETREQWDKAVRDLEAEHEESVRSHLEAYRLSVEESMLQGKVILNLRKEYENLAAENEELKKDKQGLFDQWNDSEDQGQHLGQVVRKYKREARDLKEENERLRAGKKESGDAIIEFFRLEQDQKREILRLKSEIERLREELKRKGE